MTYYYIEGFALVWFQDAEHSFDGWESILKALHTRFGPSAYDDPMECLNKLKQTSTVSNYKSQFEVLSNRIKGLSEPRRLR